MHGHGQPGWGLAWPHRSAVLCCVVLALPDHTELTSVGRGGVCEDGRWVETSFNSQLIRNMH